MARNETQLGIKSTGAAVAHSRLRTLNFLKKFFLTLNGEPPPPAFPKRTDPSSKVTACRRYHSFAAPYKPVVRSGYLIQSNSNSPSCKVSGYRFGTVSGIQ